MKIEEGKSYRTRDGRKVGPMAPRNPKTYSVSDFRWIGDIAIETGVRTTAHYIYADDGSNFEPGDNDIVAEWTDGPVRTIARKQVVPGDYGIVNIRVKFGPEVFIARRPASAPELRAAAAVLTEIADALDEAAK